MFNPQLMAVLNCALGIRNPNHNGVTARLIAIWFLQTLLICGGLLSVLTYSAGFVGKFVQSDGKRSEHIVTINQLQDISRALRGPLTILCFIISRSQFRKLEAAIAVVAKQKNSGAGSTAKKGFFLMVFSIAAFVAWDFTEWIKQGDFSLENIGSQFSNSSATFSKLGLYLVRWKFYIVWCCMGLLPVVYSFLIQTFFYLHCQELEHGIDAYYQRLESLGSTLSQTEKVASTVRKIDELLTFRKSLFGLSECINDAFQCTAGAIFCTDVVVMLFNAALVQILSSNPNYWQLTGVVLYGFYLIIFHYPLIKICFKVREYEKFTSYLFEKAIQHPDFSSALEVRMHLDALILHESQLKFDVYAGGIFPLNGGAILKAFTLIATISIAANEITSKDQQLTKELSVTCG